MHALTRLQLATRKPTANGSTRNFFGEKVSLLEQVVRFEGRHVYLLELVTQPLQFFLAPLQIFFHGTGPPLQIIVIRT